MGYIVKCYIADSFDSFNCEFSGKVHSTKEEAENELSNCKAENKNSRVIDFYIVEV